MDTIKLYPEFCHKLCGTIGRVYCQIY